MIVLGLNRGDHDASAAIVRDGELVSFISVERLTRVKHDAERLWEAVRYCLEHVGIGPDDVDRVVQNNYRCDVDRRDALGASASYSQPDAEFVSQFSEVETIGHHLAHAYCGIGLAPFDKSAVMVADGIGQHLPKDRAEAESYYSFSDGCLEPLYRRTGTLETDGLHFHSFDSIGGVYSMVSSYVFGHWNYCGKVMGLAAYGRVQDYPFQVIRKEGHELSFDLSFRHELKRGSGDRADWETHRQEYESLACGIQQETEDALIHMARWLREQTGLDDLILSGGLALNCVANQKILDQTDFKRVFVPPPAGDDGIAIGCAFYGWFEGGGRKQFALSHPYYGRRYTETEILEALEDAAFVDYRRMSDVATQTAELLTQKKVVGWFQGASAMGPRALGNRSILADPRDNAARDLVNGKVKHREPFRPFGASVLADRAAEYFQSTEDKPYMVFAVPVKPEKSGEIPAVVHADDTCRFQSVRREDNSRFYALISAFAERTGVPVVLNTSFNRPGEPIVEAPRDALNCFLGTEMDVLVLGDFLVERRRPWTGGAVHPDLLGYRIATDAQFDIQEHRYPGGRKRYTLRAPVSPIRIDIEADEGILLVLPFLDREQALGQILDQCRIDPESPTAEKIVERLWNMRTNGWIRLIAKDSLPGASS